MEGVGVDETVMVSVANAPQPLEEVSVTCNIKVPEVLPKTILADALDGVIVPPEVPDQAQV